MFLSICLMRLPCTLDGQKIGNLILSTPKTGSNLIDWGEKLDNCLASYITRVHEQKYSVLGIFEQEQLKYALGLNNFGLHQFYGRSNTLPEPKDQELIENFLKSQKIKI